MAMALFIKSGAGFIHNLPAVVNYCGVVYNGKRVVESGKIWG